MSKEDRREYEEKRMRRYLLIDSSLLMLPVSGGKRKRTFNIEDALFKLSEGRTLAVLDTTVKELEFLKEHTKGKKKLAADFALNFIRKTRIKIIEADKEIVEEVKKIAESMKGWEVHDEILARMAKKLRAAVATTDLDLMHKLRSMGVSVYYLRGRKWIYVAGEH